MPPGTPPRTLFVEVTTECNLRCRQCHMWRSQEPPTVLSTAEKTELLHQLADWSPGASVVLTGGEPLRKPAEFFSLTRTCQQRDLPAAANTHAALIEDATVDRLLTEGPRFLIVSLDSHRPELHDWIRGVPGTHDRAVSAIRRLLTRRRERFPGSDLRLLTNTIIFDGNVGELEGLRGVRASARRGRNNFPNALSDVHAGLSARFFLREALPARYHARRHRH